jgi:hypothetical protein
MTTLMPREDGQYLKPGEIITRMQATFAYVETTDEGARERVAAWLEQLAFVGDEGRGAADQCLEQLEQHQDGARFVHFGNDLGADGTCLSMLMIPHQPLIIEGHGADDQTVALIYRVATALGYEVFAPGSEVPEAKIESSKAAGEYAAAA